jgi:hypothetical protein
MVIKRLIRYIAPVIGPAIVIQRLFLNFYKINTPLDSGQGFSCCFIVGLHQDVKQIAKAMIGK